MLTYLFILVAILVGLVIVIDLMPDEIMPLSCPACSAGWSEDVVRRSQPWYIRERHGRARCRMWTIRSHSRSAAVIVASRIALYSLRRRRLPTARCDPHDDVQRVIRPEVRPRLVALPGARASGLSPGAAPLATALLATGLEQLLLLRLPRAFLLGLHPRHGSWMVIIPQNRN